jgi:ParB/RepB/Spo0J family partition protein
MTTPTPPRPPAQANRADTVHPVRGLFMIPTGMVHPNPANPRGRDLGDLTGMITSIREHGILQPLLVEDRVEHYQLIAGHRRHAAAAHLGMNHVPCLIRTTTTTTTTTVRALVENLHRLDLDPVREAEAYQALLAETGATVAVLAHQVGVSAATIRSRLDLLHLAPETRQQVQTRQLPLAAAGQLARQVKKTRTGTVTVGAPPARCPDHFTRSHPLAEAAFRRCDLAGHPTTGRYGRKASTGGSPGACGACWEQTIRDDTLDRHYR